ncbi:MAG TPA: OmpA family protein [Burkholderiales bacterium]|nr:OmpA family protein [Burkholderiales bacterium]
MNEPMSAQQLIPDFAGAPVRSALGERVYDGGESLLDDDVMRANWALPWSDLMMTMFVLFAALFAAQSFRARVDHSKLEAAHTAALRSAALQREKLAERKLPQPAAARPAAPTSAPAPAAAPSAPANKVLEPLTQIDVLARSHDAVRESKLKHVEVALLKDRSVKVSVEGPMFFAPGRANLRPEVKQFLDRLAQVIKQTPYDIHVVGHTDDRAINTGRYPSNWELSVLRASRVARYLIDSGGIDPSRFSVIGRGEYDPATANTDARSRALNRRVEIIITRDIGKTRGDSHE